MRLRDIQQAKVPKVSIIIPVYNALHFTKVCVESLLEHTSLNTAEIIVVNNGSEEDTKEFLDSKPKIKSIHLPQNLGFAGGNNCGLQEAQGEYILFLNNDTKVTPNWLNPIVRILDSEPDVGVVGNKLLYEDGTIQHCGIVFSRTNIPYHVLMGYPADHPATIQDQYFKAVTGACLTIRKNICDQIHGFNENYINGLEDMHMCLQVGELGYKIKYCAQSVIYHFESKTPGRKDKEQENFQLFIDNWGHKKTHDDFLFLRKFNLNLFVNEKGEFGYLDYTQSEYIKNKFTTQIEELEKQQNFEQAFKMCELVYNHLPNDFEITAKYFEYHLMFNSMESAKMLAETYTYMTNDDSLMSKLNNKTL